MTHNERGGRKEARGLWAWRLDAINPGDMAMISFSVSGLNKGDWKEAEIFYRGNGEIIGAEKIDETLLEEARKQERLQEVVEEFVEIDNSPEPEESSHRIVDSEIVKSQVWEAGDKLF